jgi:hypothetical protein
MEKKLAAIRDLSAKLAAQLDDVESPLADRAKAMLAETVQKMMQALTAN